LIELSVDDWKVIDTCCEVGGGVVECWLNDRAVRLRSPRWSP